MFVKGSIRVGALCSICTLYILLSQHWPHSTVTVSVWLSLLPACKLLQFIFTALVPRAVMVHVCWPIYWLNEYLHRAPHLSLIHFSFSFFPLKPKALAFASLLYCPHRIMLIFILPPKTSSTVSFLCSFPFGQEERICRNRSCHKLEISLKS